MEKSLYNFVNRRAYNKNFNNEYVIKAYRENHSLRLKERIIYNNLKLAHTLAIKYSFLSNYNLDDLFSVGCISLIEAVDSYDLSSNQKFSTYLNWKLVNDMLDYLERDMGGTVRVGYLMLRFRKYGFELFNFDVDDQYKMFEEPYFTDILNCLIEKDGVSKFVANKFKKMIPCSLEEHYGEIKNIIYFDENDCDMNEERDLYNLYNSIFSNIIDDEKIIFEKHINFCGNDYMKFKDVQKELGMKKDYVRKHYNKALDRAKTLVNRLS